MTREELKSFLSENILTSIQVAEALGTSKQVLTSYIKSKEIEPILITTQGNLFLKSDVGTFQKRKAQRLIADPFRERPTLVCKGSSHECEKYFAENRSLLDEIATVHIFFEDFDAVLKGYFQKSEYGNIASNMDNIIAPHMVITDFNGKEMWLYSCNCGYGGAGPHSSQRILKKIGVPAELIEKVVCNDIVFYYYDENRGWLVNDSISKTKKRTTTDRYYFMDTFATIYLYNNKLVLLQHNNSNEYYDIAPKQFIEKYSQFVPNPQRILLLTNQQADNLGYYKEEMGATWHYNLIIIDDSHRELWLRLNVDNDIPIRKQYTLLELLKQCGLEIKQTDTFSDKIKHWLGLMPLNAPICELQASTNIGEDKL